jgi:hypothetical protein
MHHKPVHVNLTHRPCQTNLRATKQSLGWPDTQRRLDPGKSSVKWLDTSSLRGECGNLREGALSAQHEVFQSD